MDLKAFSRAVTQIAEEKAIPQEKIIEVVEASIAAAYKKEYGKKGQIIKAEFDSKSGEAVFWQIKIVVDQDMIYSEEELEELRSRREDLKETESGHIEGEEQKKIVFNPDKHILIDEAKQIVPGIEVGQDLKLPLPSQIDFGRIAAQTAKQVLLQKIKEVERDAVMSRFQTREGEIVSGVVQRIESRAIILDIGRAYALLPKEEQVPGEFYRPDQRIKVYLLKVEDSPKGPTIIVSRAHPRLITKLFELEVPEIGNGQVKIMSIAREAGYRTKIAVSSSIEGVDPIGAMVGQRGTRIAVVINELGGEKIDVVEHSEDNEKFIANALSPAKVIEVRAMPKNVALVIVPKDQLSLAIGKGGQNVRLAAKLTGWKIDIKVVNEDGEVIEVNAQGEIIKKDLTLVDDAGELELENKSETEEESLEENNKEKIKGESEEQIAE